MSLGVRSVLVLLAALAPLSARPPLALSAAANPVDPTTEHQFNLSAAGEAVASITAGCARCDWGIAGREAVALKLAIDGVYSQHLLLTRGEVPVEYRVMLGSLTAGSHRLTFERDAARSAKDAGDVSFGAISVQAFGVGTSEYPWLSRAPILHARPGTVERFSDVPLVMYVEATPNEVNSYRYTVIFTNEDGGTPTDRLMATWGRTTDIEYVYGVGTGATDDPARKEEFQGAEHELRPFMGARAGTHPLLWVSTENNMVSDTGPAEFVRFAPAPQLVVARHRLAGSGDGPEPVDVRGDVGRNHARGADRSRPRQPEAARSRIRGGSRFSKAAPRCGMRRSPSTSACVARDPIFRGLPLIAAILSFRIARTGCFRAAVPLPDGVTPSQLAGLRIRAYTRPPRQGEPPLATGAGQVVLQRINTVFMLDRTYRPVSSSLHWMGSLDVKPESGAVDVPVTGR